MELTLVVPIYNESGSLPVLLTDIEGKRNPGIKFLLVDNGSTDYSVIETLRAGGPNWTSIRVDKNIGFGGAIKHGVRSSRSAYIGWFPGNLRINTEELFVALENLNFGEDVVVKFRRNRSQISDRLKTLAFGLIQTLFTGSNLMDSGGTPTITTRRLAHVLVSLVSPNDYTFESFAFLFFRLSRLRVVRPRIKYGPRTHGSSHWQRGLKSEFLLLLTTLKGAVTWKKEIKRMSVK